MPGVHGREVGRILAVVAQKVDVQIGDGRLVEARVEDAEVLLKRRALAEAERLLGLERLRNGIVLVRGADESRQKKFSNERRLDYCSTFCLNQSSQHIPTFYLQKWLALVETIIFDFRQTTTHTH